MKIEINSRRPLTERQRAFCRHRVAGMANAEAYRKAGYSPNGATLGATRLLKRKAIREELARVRNNPRGHDATTAVQVQTTRMGSQNVSDPLVGAVAHR